MKVVLDTNLFLVMLPRQSNDHDLFLNLLKGDYEVCITPDILFEYEEVVGRKNGHQIAEAAAELLVSLPNVHFIRKYFYWNLIAADPDDDKFSDCYVAAGADYLVSDDKHFRVLKSVGFPKIQVITKVEFRQLLGLQT